MDHLFIELMVKEKQDAALKGLAGPGRYPSPVRQPRPSPVTRLMDGIGDILISLGRHLKTRYGQPAPCLAPARACPTGPRTCGSGSRHA